MTVSKHPFLLLWFTVTTLYMAVANFLTKGRKYKTYLRRYFVCIYSAQKFWFGCLSDLRELYSTVQSVGARNHLHTFSNSGIESIQNFAYSQLSFLLLTFYQRTRIHTDHSQVKFAAKIFKHVIPARL